MEEISVSNSNFAKKRKLSDDRKFSDNGAKTATNNLIDKRKYDDIIHQSSSCQSSQQNYSCSSRNSESTQALSLSLQELMEEELRCSICKEMFIHPVTLNCSHSFCDFCICQWKKEENTCPICRQEINTENATLVLDKCVDRVLDFTSEKIKKRRKETLLDREERIRLENTSHSTSSHYDLSDSSEDNDFLELLLDFSFHDQTQQNDALICDDFDQCVIN